MFVKEHQLNWHKPQTSNLYRELFISANNFIDSHCDNKELKIKSFSDHVHSSIRTVQRSMSFHQTTWKKLLNKKRMQKSRVLVCTTEKNITEISVEVGYSSASQFSRAFKKYYGKTPREYRKIVKDHTFDLS
jgi:AraC-like DNA-binding protein